MHVRERNDSIPYFLLMRKPTSSPEEHPAVLAVGATKADWDTELVELNSANIKLSCATDPINEKEK